MKTFRYTNLIPAVDGDAFIFDRNERFLVREDVFAVPVTPRLIQADDGFTGPEVLPGVIDDDFLLGKDAYIPLVLPGVDDFGEGPTGFDFVDQPVQLIDHMTTLGDDGFLLGPTEDLGRLHDHDGWLF